MRNLFRLPRELGVSGPQGLRLTSIKLRRDITPKPARMLMESLTPRPELESSQDADRNHKVRHVRISSVYVGRFGNNVGAICTANSLNTRSAFGMCRLPR